MFFPVYLSALLVVGLAVLIGLYIVRRQRRNYSILHTRSPPHSVFSPYDSQSRMLPVPSNWEEVELGAINASMEATTAV